MAIVCLELRASGAADRVRGENRRDRGRGSAATPLGRAAERHRADVVQGAGPRVLSGHSRCLVPGRSNLRGRGPLPLHRNCSVVYNELRAIESALRAPPSLADRDGRPATVRVRSRAKTLNCLHMASSR